MKQSFSETLVIYGSDGSFLGISATGMLSLYTAQSTTATNGRTCVCGSGQTLHGGLHLDLLVTTECIFSAPKSNPES